MSNNAACVYAKIGKVTFYKAYVFNKSSFSITALVEGVSSPIPPFLEKLKYLLGPLETVSS